MISYSQQIKNYIEYSRRPFTSGMVRDDLQISFIKVKRAIAELVKKGYLKVIGREGKYKIYIKNPEYVEEPLTNAYGYNYKTMREVYRLVKRRKITSSRQLNMITGHSRRSMVRYLTAFVSAGYIDFQNGVYTTSKKEVHYCVVGKEFKHGILEEIRRRKDEQD